MKILRYLKPVFANSILIVIILCSTVRAELPLMKFSFEGQEFDIGSTFDVDVRISQSDRELGSYSYTLLFDKQVLKILSIEGGMHGNLPDANSTGSVNIADYNQAWDIIDSCLQLTRITFQIIGDYCSVSELTLSQVSLYDNNIQRMDAETINSGINVICPKAKLTGVPQGTINDNYALIQVTGTGLTHYKYSLDNKPYSEEISIASPISLYNLSEGAHCIHVLGKIASVWQAELEASNACWYIFMPKPHIQKISPVYGSEKGKTIVDIEGLYFNSDCRVFFGEIEAETLTISNTHIVCRTPEHIPKTVSVTLENPYEKITTQNRAFSYYPEGNQYQMIFTELNDTRIAPGANVFWQMKYTTSDKNPYLPGLGIRIHYNSNLLKWRGFTDIFDNDMLGGRDLMPKKDSSNLDNDPKTDKCIQVAWMDISRNWSGQVLPHALFGMSFSTPDDVGINTESAIHFSSSSHATTHQFLAPSIAINFQSWSIECTAQGSGSISPSDMISVAHNNSQHVQFIPDPHYHIEDVFIDGASRGQINAYTFENVTANHMVTVIYAIDRVTLTLEKRGSGTGMIKPMEGTYTYDYNTGVVLTTIASESSIFTGWSGDVTGIGDISIIMNKDKHIFANFDIKKFKIEPIFGDHGHISPSEPFYIDYNGSQIIKIFADRCYEIDNVWINGESRGQVLNHNFIDVRADQTIEAIFKIKDKDSDGLPDCMEANTGCTDVNVPDSDNDGLLDGEEDLNQDGFVDPGETSPCEPDSDFDGMDDGWELTYGMDPLIDDAMVDKDEDGYANYFEYLMQQHPEEPNLPYQRNYNPETDNRQPFQVVNLQPDHLKIVPGGHFDLEVIYNVSNNNAQSKGIGFYVHFSSDDIMFTALTSMLTNGIKVTEPEIKTDQNDWDNDPKTDRYIELLWQDENGQWPDTVLPQKLCTMTFSVSADMPENYSNYIRVTSFFIDSVFHFYSTAAQYQAQRGNLDIDGNGVEDALTDGLLVMGYLYGFRNMPLIDNAVGPYAVRTEAQQIEPLIKGMYDLFDIDGDGIVNALADGLLLVRYLFGFRDYELVYNLITPNCTRCNADDIIEYIRKIKPNPSYEE